MAGESKPGVDLARGRAHSRCKGPEVRIVLVSLRNSRKASVAGQRK